ncbi:MAG: T9SS type A sorting domain-containing protein [Lewinellaceae bacterium]|nr:T9SS type A sorting domain-containing protein [Lewinellaceae bacterium]
MNRIFRLLAFALLYPLFLNAQNIPISEARTQIAGSVVTVSGIATNGDELGKIRYLQDGTAGIAAFPGAGSAPGFEAAVKAGDSIRVTGTLVLFHGLLEISPITDFQVISSNNPLPAPKMVALADISDELEGQLLNIECVNFDAAGGVFSGSGTYNIVDADGTSAKIYIRSGHPLQNTDIPGGPVHLTAILSEFDDFQLLPRYSGDLAPTPCFYFTEKPDQSDIQKNGFTVNWKTNQLSSAKLRFGATPAPVTEVVLPIQTLTHSYTLTGLEPGAIYWVQVEAQHNGETILSEVTPFATRSLSSGEIKVYFNHPVDLSSANGLEPAGQSFDEVLDEILLRIASAEQSIDVALYNNNRIDITNALKQAHIDGVRVRYVASIDASSPALDPPPFFPVIYGNVPALMHNKFMVIDADLSDKCWVMGGSMNWTTGNMTDDFNNVLFIQDQSLARAYELEFEEMWGSDGTLPNAANSRFGAEKRDNTPHKFIIGDIPVESWFSPSDQVTGRISEAIRSADSEALFAMFSFTKDEQANALVEVFDQGAQVRGMIENIGDQGAEFDYLLSQGVNVQHHAISGSLHHKYSIIDADIPGSDPLVVTGSHNWSFSAETANDENTLIIHDAGIATLYRSEFERRWVENTTSTHTPASISVAIMPNPARDRITLNNVAQGTISIRDAAGKEWMSGVLPGNTTAQLDVRAVPAGNYFAVIRTRHGVTTVPFQKIQH